MNKQYIGDSVCVSINDFGEIVLTTENGLGPSNIIYLEPEVYRKLVEYVKLANKGELSDG